MSECDDDSLSGCLLILFVTIAIITVIYVVNEELTKRDNYIYDLQRRMGQLEQRLK